MDIHAYSSTAAASNGVTASKDSVPHADEVYRVGADVTFCTDINMRSTATLIRLLRAAEAESLADVEKAKAAVTTATVTYKQVRVTVEPQPITLTLTTYGGSVHAAWAVVDAIRAIKVPVHTVVAGYCASAGTLISLAGARRTIGANAYMLLHEVRSGFWGRFSHARDNMEDLQKIMDHIVRYYGERTAVSEADWRELLSRDRDWDADECIRRKIVDAKV